MARRNTNSLCVGDLLKDDVFHLESIKQSGTAGYSCKFTDKKGELYGFIPVERYKDGYAELVGGPVLVKGPILANKESQPCVKVKALEKAEKGSYVESDLYDGLSEQSVNAYLGIIAETKKVITDKDLLNLVNLALTDEVLKKLAVMPASLKYHGRYAGGALATTACVTKMALQMAASYIKNGNGLYTLTVDWSILATAGLLHTAAIPSFYTEERPFAKTAIGVQRGYMSLLEEKILSSARAANLDTCDERVSKVLNVLECSVPMKTLLHSTGAEGRLMVSAIRSYKDLDMLACGLSEAMEEDSDSIYTFVKGVGYVFPKKKVGDAA